MSSKPKIKNGTKKPASSDDWIAQAHVLTEALPFMQRYDRKTVVIKYGGHAMGDADWRANLRAMLCCSNNPASIRLLCMAAARKLRPCLNG